MKLFQALSTGQVFQFTSDTNIRANINSAPINGSFKNRNRQLDIGILSTRPPPAQVMAAPVIAPDCLTLHNLTAGAKKVALLRRQKEAVLRQQFENLFWYEEAGFNSYALDGSINLDRSPAPPESAPART